MSTVEDISKTFGVDPKTLESEIEHLSGSTYGKVTPVGHQFQSSDGTWCNFVNEDHYRITLKTGLWKIREIFTVDSTVDESE